MKGINTVALARMFKQAVNTINRYHITIIVVLVFGALIATVANVNLILSQPPDESYRNEAEHRSIRSDFDQETIDAINQLKQRQENPNLSLPPGRINPFTE